MLICTMPLLAMPFFSSEGSSENRTLSAFPSLKTEEGINLNYLSDLGAYFSDHYAFREDLVSLNAKITAKIFGVSSEDDIILGTDGWLYYSSTLDDYQHNNSVSERTLYSMARNTKLMQEYSNLLGVDFIFIIAPNKNSLYGQNMPSIYKTNVSPESDARRLLPYLQDESVNYIDLFELFENQDEVLYYKEDSHWTEKGALLVYNTLLDYNGTPHEDYSSVTPEIVNDHVGDLASMLYASNAGFEERLLYIPSPSYSYINGANVDDTLINTYNPSGSGNLLMYRDSFGNSLLPFFANAYENAQFSKSVPYQMTDLITASPDLLIVEKVERHIQTLAQVPPVMSAPERFDIEYNSEIPENALVSTSVKDNGIFYEIQGFVKNCTLSLKSNIYIKISTDDSSRIYEAFLIGSKIDGSYNDQGFKAYIPSLDKLPESTNISVIADVGNGYQVVKESSLN